MSAHDLVTKAVKEAEAAAARVVAPVEKDGRPRGRWWVLGDPQCSLPRLFGVLAEAGLLDGDGRLRPEVGLVSMGDHFDFKVEPGMTVAQASREGEAFLAWLASHPPDQVVLLGGNHDLSRVMELAEVTDAAWAGARALADRIRPLGFGTQARAELEEVFHARFPQVPTPGLASRDLVGFRESQRTLVQQLLLHGRMRLAATAVLEDGVTKVLLTHAGVTRRELGMLGLSDGAEPEAVASALESRLAAAVAEVAGRWRAGAPAELSLHPLSVTGRTRQEGGGFLYHRPALRTEEPDVAWCFRPESPRRYEPHALPRGLVQVAGHVGHRRCVERLGTYVEEAAKVTQASVRTLSILAEGQGSYRVGVFPPEPAAATLYLVDPSFSEGVQVGMQWLTLGGVT